MPIQLIVIIQYLNNLFNIKNTGLMLISGLMSFLSLKIIDFDLIIGDSDIQKLTLPIIIEGMCIFLYLIQATGDLITGIKASKKVNQRRKVIRKNPIQSHRLYKTIWKILGVISLTVTVCFFTVVCELLNSIVYYLFIWSLIWIWILVLLFEWKSIGENLERIDGKKPYIFMFMQKLLNTVEESGINKIKNTIEGENNIKINKEEKEIN